MRRISPRQKKVEATYAETIQDSSFARARAAARVVDAPADCAAEAPPHFLLGQRRIMILKTCLLEGKVGVGAVGAQLAQVRGVGLIRWIREARAPRAVPAESVR
eukprot:9232001-Pyramimonas_sp.AAC.1